MFDPNFLAYCGVAALLVLSPGPTWAVVADATIAAGRRAGLWTVAGAMTANSSLALASAFGMAAIVHRFPQVLTVLSVVGGLYLAWLGVRALRRAVGPEDAELKGNAARGNRFARAPMSRFGLGLLTNYSNPSVVLFYTVVVPQFIRPSEPFVRRYLLLGGTHIGMAIVWLCVFAISVGTLATRMTRPSVRRAMDGLTAAALLGFASKILAGLVR